MKPLSIRRISLAVAVGGMLVPHWGLVPRGPLDTPLAFTIGLLAGIVLLVAYGVRQPPDTGMPRE